MIFWFGFVAGTVFGVVALFLVLAWFYADSG